MEEPREFGQSEDNGPTAPARFGTMARRNRSLGWILLSMFLAWLALPGLLCSALLNGFDDPLLEYGLAACGPRALPVIMDNIGHVGRSTASVGLIHPVRQIGAPAHQALLRGADGDLSAPRKVSCALMLLWAFDDPSRIDVWVVESAKHKGGLARMLEAELRGRSRDPAVPPIRLSEGTLNPDFVKWFERWQKPLGMRPLKLAGKTAP